MLREDLFKLGCNIITEVLEDMDDYLRRSGVRKNKWEIVRKDKTIVYNVVITLLIWLQGRRKNDTAKYRRKNYSIIPAIIS